MERVDVGAAGFGGEVFRLQPSIALSDAVMAIP